jgi:hypothetical protein
MSKVFSPLTLGVGFTALLALVPGLGLGTKPGPPAPAAGAAAPTAKDRKVVSVTALLERCLRDNPQGPQAPVDVTILTLPDPQRTNMAFWFDLRLNAVQRAFRAYDFLPRAFFLPWEATSRETTGAGLSSDFPDASPGLIWFRRDGKAPASHALFIVGESQSLGLNREALAQAFRLAARLPLREPREIAILGPQFSGSLTSLGAALESHLKDPAAPGIRVQGTTTLDTSGARILREAVGPIDPKRLSLSGWLCNLSGASKDRLLDWYMTEAGWPRDASKVALFTESNTVYSGSPRDAQRAVPVTPILYPMGLSRLRSERRAMEHNLAKGGETELVLPSTLLGLTEEDAARVLDTVPQFASDTVRNTELTLAGTILSLSRRGYTHIGISASDPQDLIFLAERIRAYHPSCTLFTTSGNHLLFAHPSISSALDGMVLFGGYPLTDAMRVLSLKKGDLESSVRFTSEGEYATYYATLLRLDPARANDAERRFWGKQGFVSIVKGGSIWPLRHGGVVTGGEGAPVWDTDMEATYREAAAHSADLGQYVHSRLLQLSLLLLLLGLTSGLAFLRPLLEVAGQASADLSLRPYRNLVAGALLALAIESFLAVGYLLPLAVLAASPWRDVFLWTGLGVWSLLLALTVRALRVRLGWFWTVLLALAAMGPAAVVALWGRSHFLVFMPAYLRFTSPGRGVSLIPTLVLLSAGVALLLRTWYDVRRQDHDAFWPRPAGLAVNHGPRLRLLRGLRFQPWVFGFLTGLMALQLALPGGLIRPLMETQSVTAVVVAASGGLYLASIFLFWQLHCGWRDLRHVLEELELGTYRAAFAEAGRLVDWNAMRALGRGLKTHRSSLRGRELLKAQAAWASAAVPGYGACLGALEAIEAELPRGRQRRSDFEKWWFRFKVARQMTACGDALEAACARDPEAAASHRGEVDLFRALRAIQFIREAFLVVRHLLIGALGSMLLLVLSVSAFDFQPKGDVLLILGGTLLVMAGWIAWAILHVERDPLLCLMEGTQPGEVQLSVGLVENGFRFVLVPLLLLLATFYPALGGVVMQVFNPLMHILK